MHFCVFVILFALICGCSNSELLYSVSDSSDVEVVADSRPGMLRVNATGASVVLGTDNEEARVSERPAMTVKFDYDFSMARHEVTCGEFDALMKSSTGLVLGCENDSLPATNLTYYDAVLFANARSKSEGLDTAYSYSSTVFDSEGRCTNLEGLVFLPENLAYRLPTEAEWALVASLKWESHEGWTADNSDYRLHPVCNFATADDFCDLVGNAMEWVNDWQGSFRDTTITNYLGAPDGGMLGQRVVKGGSYRNADSSISLYGRGDVYTVTSSTRADYVGFRLALGVIPSAVWMGNDGRANSSRVAPLANATTIHRMTGTYKVKLAFRNDMTGNIAYVDYSGGIPSVVEIADTINAFHPEISPDGRLVAFCTKIEGTGGKSELYVRDLNADGSNLVKLNVESAAIPRWRVLADGDTAIVYVTDAGNNKDDASFKSASTWQIPFAKGKFGRPQKLFDGAYHGGISEDGTLAVTGARLLRARVADSGSTVLLSARDTIWYKNEGKAEQACNASLARDSSKRTLFLDFGGKTGQSFVGEDYGTHERILVVDSRGKLVQSAAAPEGFSFDHSEWAYGNRNLVVATLTNLNGAHRKIVLIDMDDGNLVELAEGDELWHPCLWFAGGVSADVLLDLDSAGAYLPESHVRMQSEYRVKMELFWKNLDKHQVILFGSSRMEKGVDPDMFPEWNMLNMGVLGIDPLRDMYIAKNYALNHPQNLKAIAFSIDLDSWNGVEEFLSLLLDYCPGYRYDADHGFWADEIPKGFVEAVENSYPAEYEVRNEFGNRGGTEVQSRSWDADGIDVLSDSVFSEESIAFMDDRFRELESIVEQASKNGIYVVGIIFPQAPQYRNTGAFGLYGLQRSVAQKKIAYLDSLAAKNRYFVLMDENKMGNHDYTDAMAQNRDHLSTLGARHLTARLDSVLKTLKW